VFWSLPEVDHFGDLTNPFLASPTGAADSRQAARTLKTTPGERFAGPKSHRPKSTSVPPFGAASAGPVTQFGLTARASLLRSLGKQADSRRQRFPYGT
jgi:hypothetical protein